MARMKGRSTAMAAILFAAAPGLMAEPVDVLFLDGYENACGNLVYSDGFSLIDGSAWPAAWSPLGNVALADIQQGAARLRPNPTTYSLARMGAAIATRNVELRFTLRMEDGASQGIGFYVRQNGGYLHQTNPQGQGYAVFVEGTFRNQPGVSVWKEEAGSEIELAHAAPAAPMATGADYRVRFQVLQLDATHTRLRAKLWLAGDAEPAAWQPSVDDPTAVLQNISGGIAIDSWSSYAGPPITAHSFVDNIELISLCAP